MANDSNSSDCETTYISQEIMGSIGAVMCVIALIFVLASRFYKDIAQRLIVYKLIAMLVYSLVQLLYLKHETTKYGVLLSDIAYNVNLILTLWLISLYCTPQRTEKLQETGTSCNHNFLYFFPFCCLTSLCQL